MAKRTGKMSAVCVGMLVLLGAASAQGIQFDLILEKTFASPTEEVGIDYDAQGKPIFTIASDDRVEVTDSEGNTTTIVSGLTEFDWVLPSENGRFVGVLKESEAVDTVSGDPYLKYHFTLKRRNGQTVYEFPNSPFNDFRVGNNGSICGTGRVHITSVVDWQYYDPAGNLTRQFRASGAIPFGESGCYLVDHRDSVSAYTGDHTLIWSIDLSSPAIGWATSDVSADGRYFVRCGAEATAFYRDGELVKIDSTLLESWKPRVAMTPDNRHALVISAHRAYLWDLEELSQVRTYETHPPVSFQNAISSSEGQYVVFYTFARDASGPGQYLVHLYNPDAQLVWQAEGPPVEMIIPSVHWLTIDPTATYISQRGYAKLWLYKRR